MAARRTCVYILFFFSPNYGIYNFFIWNAWAVHVLPYNLARARCAGTVRLALQLYPYRCYLLSTKEICVWVFVRPTHNYSWWIFFSRKKENAKMSKEKENSNKRNVKRTNFIQLVRPNVVQCRCLCMRCMVFVCGAEYIWANGIIGDQIENWPSKVECERQMEPNREKK